MNPDLEKIILSAEQISSRIQEIAEDINQHYQDTVREIILITLLDGAIVFTADLIRHISVPLRLDCIRVSSYGNSTNPETAPRILGSLKSEVQDKHILLVDDILDTGNTMKRVFEEVSSKYPASLRTCVFWINQKEEKIIFRPIGRALIFLMNLWSDMDWIMQVVIANFPTLAL